MKAHYLQHVSFEGLGYIEQWLEEQDYATSGTKFYEGQAVLPDQDSFDTLIILGGPMGINDHGEYPWLAQEKEFIRQSISNNKVVLGICLGAQLIAASLGAKVGLANHKEIGWFPVMPNHKCNTSEWIHELFRESPTVFHWHGDRFEIPSGSGCNLLSSPANGNQAFAYGKKVLGLQFHLEATEQSIKLMLRHGIEELTSGKFVQSREEILSGLVHMQENHQLMEKILYHLREQVG